VAPAGAPVYVGRNHDPDKMAFSGVALYPPLRSGWRAAASLCWVGDFQQIGIAGLKSRGWTWDSACEATNRLLGPQISRFLEENGPRPAQAMAAKALSRAWPGLGIMAQQGRECDPRAIALGGWSRQGLAQDRGIRLAPPWTWDSACEGHKSRAFSRKTTPGHGLEQPNCS
jgi:hypothetical protein